MATTVRIEFENTSNQDRLELDYELLDRDFSRRWVMVLQKALDRRRVIHNAGNFYGAGFVSEPELRAKIEESLRIINSHKRKWIDLEPYPSMSRQFLMKLHEEFEILEPHPDFQVANSPAEVRVALCNLNVYIHRYEGLDGAKVNHIDVLFHPVDRFYFQEEDYDLFQVKRVYGELFLAYGVTGVPILNAFQTDHMNEPVPQYNYTAGMTLWLASNEEFHQRDELNQWMMRKWGWHPGHPKQAIGYVTLGHLRTAITGDEIAARIGQAPKVTGVHVLPRPSMQDFHQIEPAPSNAAIGNPTTEAFRSPPRPELPQFVVELESAENGSTEELAFGLVDHAVTRKWLELVKAAIAERRPIVDHGMFFGFDLASQDALRETVRAALAELQGLGLGEMLPPDVEKLLADGVAEPVRRLEALIDGDAALRNSEPAMNAAYRLLRTLQKIGCANNTRGGHINVDCHGDISVPLADHDYVLFSPDTVWGGLYLTYGQLGTPTQAAFRARSREPFQPQRGIKAGVTVSLYPEEHFQGMNEYRAWLSENGKDASDPKLAFGTIRLGRLDTSLSRPELVERVRRHARVKSVSLRERERAGAGARAAEPRPPESGGGAVAAHWPRSKELFRHLELTPWLMLPFEFDHEGCYREAAALLERFVVHRSYDQSSDGAGRGKWKSLGIRALGGDSAKTQYHTDYGATEPDYRLSDIAEFCPKTLAFLSRITDLDACERIRFMLLEPGARIATHSDAPNQDVAFAVNVALNMPDKCEFWADLNADGTPNPYSRKIPIRDGSAFIFNNARYHQLFNDSDQPRIHLIFHGPLRFSDERLLGAARAQNGLPDEKSLMNALVGRYARLGREIAPNSELCADWVTSGIDAKVIPDSVRLAVVREPVEEELAEEAVHRITLAGLFPARPPIIRTEEVDRWLGDCADQGASHGVLITAGTYAAGLANFLTQILRAVYLLDTQDAAVMGHIMNRPDRPEDLPFLHEQFAIVDLKRWTALGRTSLSVPYDGREATFPGYRASPENIHDDYTPLWLKPDPSAQPRRGRAGFGTALLARSLEAGLSVVNVPIPLRATKRFTYPRTGRCPQYLAIKKEIGDFLAREQQKVYVFNNECPTVLPLPGFRPDILVSVAAGFKPLSILRQYWPDRAPERIVLVDISKRALEHFRWLTLCRTYDSVVNTLVSEFGRHQPVEGDAHAFVERHLEAVLRDSFGGEFRELARGIELLGRAELVNADFISDPEHVLSALAPGRSGIFWHSNAWSSNMSMYRGSRAELDENYRKVGRAISAKHGLRGWSRVGNQEMIFGSEFESPRILVTSGGHPFEPAPSEFRELP